MRSNAGILTPPQFDPRVKSGGQILHELSEIHPLVRGEIEKDFVLAVVGIVAALVISPWVGHWVWGGGWLAALGQNLGLGHGYVDVAGAGATVEALEETLFLARLARTVHLLVPNSEITVSTIVFRWDDGSTSVR